MPPRSGRAQILLVFLMYAVSRGSSASAWLACCGLCRISSCPDVCWRKTQS